MQSIFNVLSIGVLLGITGCAQQSDLVTEVIGQVTLDDKPLADADVLFWPVDLRKGCATRRTNHEGQYLVNPDSTYERLAQGEYKVVVTKFVNGDGSPADRAALMLFWKFNSPKDPPGLRNNLPEKYRSQSTSPLRVEFQAGANQPPVIALSSK